MPLSKIFIVLTFSLCLSFQLSSHINQPPSLTTQQVEEEITKQLLNDKLRKKLERESEKRHSKSIQRAFSLTQKNILTYSLFFNYNTDKIAEKLGLSEETVKREMQKIEEIKIKWDLSDEEIKKALAIA